MELVKLRLIVMQYLHTAAIKKLCGRGAVQKLFSEKLIRFIAATTSLCINMNLLDER